MSTELGVAFDNFKVIASFDAEMTLKNEHFIPNSIKLSINT